MVSKENDFTGKTKGTTNLLWLTFLRGRPYLLLPSTMACNNYKRPQEVGTMRKPPFPTNTCTGSPKCMIKKNSKGVFKGNNAWVDKKIHQPWHAPTYIYMETHTHIHTPSPSHVNPSHHFYMSPLARAISCSKTTHPLYNHVTGTTQAGPYLGKLSSTDKGNSYRYD